MIQTFHAVGASSSEMSAQVAGGVSRALITTQIGLAIAIPGVFGLAHLRRLVRYLRVGLGAVKLNTVFIGEQK
jgi:biopolymer transport protein ExbB/TolQ